MRKIIVKTESVEDFLKRGGEIKVVRPRNAPRTYTRRAAAKLDLGSVDMSALPTALKIRYGIKE